MILDKEEWIWLCFKYELFLSLFVVVCYNLVLPYPEISEYPVVKRGSLISYCTKLLNQHLYVVFESQHTCVSEFRFPLSSFQNLLLSCWCRRKAAPSWLWTRRARSPETGSSYGWCSSPPSASGSSQILPLICQK